MKVPRADLSLHLLEALDAGAPARSNDASWLGKLADSVVLDVGPIMLKAWWHPG